MAARIGQLDEQVVRQQELLYNVEFQLQQVRLASLWTFHCLDYLPFK